MRKYLMLISAAFLLLAVFPALAQEPAPVQVTPAAPVPKWLQYSEPYVGEETNVANPHKTTEEITMWAQQTAAEVLTLSPKDHKEKLISFKKFFVKSGWQLYTGYVRDKELVSLIEDNGYSIGAIVDNVPEILSQGPVEGLYHWIVKMPLTISIFGKDEMGEIKAGASGKYIVYMDIMRVPEADIAIANWRVDDMPAAR